MKFRFAVVAMASLMLCGCADAGFSFDDILGFPSGDADEAQAPQARADSVPSGSATAATGRSEAPSTFCRDVATQAASEGVFDASTQARVAQKSYAQCVAQFSANAN